MFDLKNLFFSNLSVISCMVPDHKCLVRKLLNDLSKFSNQLKYSHNINGRWENGYLPIDLVPDVKIPMKYARDIAMQEWNIRTVAQFKSLSRDPDTLPPFWFNVMCNGHRTGIHDHAKIASVSGVFYLQCQPDSGDLFFRKEGEKDLHFQPKVGKMILFPSNLKHGVLENKSSTKRISLAFNLFSFPINHTEW